MVNDRYDYIFLGTSVLCSLEAVHLARQGKKVLMLDEQRNIGGAWETLDLFGLSGVENAIHYFLPDKKGIRFMKENLNWSVEHTPCKYRVFPLPGLGYGKLRYDKRLSNVIRSLLYPETGFRPLQYIRNLLGDIFNSNTPSYYLKAGSPEMLVTIRKLLAETDISVINGITIKKIDIDNDAGKVEVSTETDTFSGTTIYFTHGSRIYNLTGNGKPFPVVEQDHLRPAAHLYVEDSLDSEILECIFTGDSLIKYAHDITRFTDQYESIKNTRKVFVLALKHHVRETPDIYRELLGKLAAVGMVGADASVIGMKWTDVYLPRIGDDDLYTLKSTFKEQVEIMRTEDFARGVGLNADRWSKTINLT